MRQHDPTIHFNPRSPHGERPAAEAIHIRANFLKLACYLGEKAILKNNTGVMRFARNKYRENPREPCRSEAARR